MDIHEMEIISNEANEALNKPPSWIFKWGMLSVALTGLAVLALMSIIPYTEKLVLPVTLDADHKPVPVISPYAGSLTAIHFKNGAPVQKDAILANLNDSSIPAPVSGYISLYKHSLHTAQLINAHDTLCYIIPRPPQKDTVVYVGLINGADADKVKPGTSVSLLFNDQRIVLAGYIRELSLVPDADGKRAVFIALRDDTTQVDQLPFYASLVKGNARIILRERKIIQQLLQ
jgi:multidrug resistance efflux pump